MSDWTSGYVADIEYTFGYYTELNPLQFRLPFLASGLVPPEVGTCCELGYGQGMSANLHAAASDARWYGTDFNPSHAAFAQAMAAASGADARLYEQSFAEFCGRADLPDFDFIGFHGIWSWISAENRAVITDFLARKLKPGGVLYVSYNAQPGWAAMGPMRDLFFEHNATLSPAGQGAIARFDAALAFAERLLAVNPGFAIANPSVKERVAALKDKNRNYLVHEYFDRDWHPMSFAQVKSQLAPAKLGFACSSNCLDQVDVLNLTAEQQALLKEIPDAGFRETVRDYCVNTQFRRDYWVKGPRRFSALGQAEALRAHRVVLTRPRADVPLKLTTRVGEATLHEKLYGPVLDALASHQPTTLGQIEQAVKGKGIPMAQVVQVMLVLAAGGNVMSAQDDASIAKARKQTAKLNALICDMARANADVQFLASPVTGGGFPVGRFQQLFLLVTAQGKKTAAERAQFVWALLEAQGQRIVKDGKALESAADSLADLTAQAQVFADKQLPILKAVGIA